MNIKELIAVLNCVEDKELEVLMYNEKTEYISRIDKFVFIKEGFCLKNDYEMRRLKV